MKLLNVGLMIDAVENGFQKAMKKVCTEYRELNCGGPPAEFNQKLLNLTYDFKPDLIFIQIQAPNILYPDTAEQIGRVAFVMNFSGDVRHELPNWYLHIGRYIQLSTYTNMVDVERSLKAGVKADYLEIGVDPERYKKHDEFFPTPDIVAMFNNYGAGHFDLSAERIEAVDKLRNAFGTKFGLYGHGWNHSETGNLNGDQVLEAKYYNNAKIAINISHFNYKRYASDRMLRILASGIFCLSHHYDGIEMDYTPGVHLDTFHNLDEMIQKCKYYLTYPEAREKIALQGQQHCLNNFTFDHMAKNVIKLYNQHKK